MFLSLWSRGESNPGPNRKPICLLHAYPVLDFCAAAGGRQPRLNGYVVQASAALSSCFLVHPPEHRVNQPCFFGASEPETAGQDFGETARSAALPQKKPVSTLLRSGSERVISFASYLFVTGINERDYRLGMLTYQFILLSKPFGPWYLRSTKIQNLCQIFFILNQIINLALNP